MSTMKLTLSRPHWNQFQSGPDPGLLSRPIFHIYYFNDLKNILNKNNHFYYYIMRLFYKIIILINIKLNFIYKNIFYMFFFIICYY